MFIMILFGLNEKTLFLCEYFYYHMSFENGIAKQLLLHITCSTYNLLWTVYTKKISLIHPCNVIFSNYNCNINLNPVVLPRYWTLRWNKIICKVISNLNAIWITPNSSWINTFQMTFVRFVFNSYTIFLSHKIVRNTTCFYNVVSKCWFHIQRSMKNVSFIRQNTKWTFHHSSCTTQPIIVHHSLFHC